MNVSVVIPLINEQERVAHAIAQAWLAGAYEVIVVDGGSRDETPARAQRQRCTFLTSPPGRARQQNAGAAVATGEVVLFLHADTHLPAGAIDQIRQALTHNSILAGAFRQHIESAGLLYRGLEWGNAARVRWWSVAYGDQGIFVRRAVFFELGGFPPTELLEDLLLSRHLRRRSQLVLLPGPLYVSPRRWKQHGVVRQTLRNWGILAAHRCGVSPARLARWYRRHDAS